MRISCIACHHKLYVRLPKICLLDTTIMLSELVARASNVQYVLSCSVNSAAAAKLCVHTPWSVCAILTFLHNIVGLSYNTFHTQDVRGIRCVVHFTEICHRSSVVHWAAARMQMPAHCVSICLRNVEDRNIPKALDAN